TAATLYLGSGGLELPWLARLFAFVIAGFALFRLGSMYHEIVHFKPTKPLKRFALTWDILAGIPMLMPSFLYQNHLDHHRTSKYGTGVDGEYLPLGNARPYRIVLLFFVQVV
ncbi:MAG: hypothetical protein GTO41_11085, partial [Burkholderiales bacterium]|nr:hypothetical protein [Burkholderiales bacterium]